MPICFHCGRCPCLCLDVYAQVQHCVLNKLSRLIRQAWNVATAANVPANLGVRPVVIVLLAVNSLQTKVLRVCDVLWCDAQILISFV